MASSLNAFLNGACAGPAGVVGGGGDGSGSVRASSSVSVGGVYGVDAPLRQLIETKERELHEIHDFRIRYACNRETRGQGGWVVCRSCW